jgi:hypothetical protein
MEPPSTEQTMQDPRMSGEARDEVTDLLIDAVERWHKFDMAGGQVDFDATREDVMAVATTLQEMAEAMAEPVAGSGR